MLAFALTVLALTATAVLFHSWMRAVRAIGETRRALANCSDTVTASVRIVDHVSPRLRIVSSAALRPLPQPALLVAA